MKKINEKVYAAASSLNLEKLPLKVKTLCSMTTNVVLNKSLNFSTFSFLPRKMNSDSICLVGLI